MNINLFLFYKLYFILSRIHCLFYYINLILIILFMDYILWVYSQKYTFIFYFFALYHVLRTYSNA
jgi:hypothetical protein